MAELKLKPITLWLAVISSLLSVITGIIHLTSLSASIEWPSDFLDDINTGWRSVFTFRPGNAGTLVVPKKKT